MRKKFFITIFHILIIISLIHLITNKKSKKKKEKKDKTPRLANGLPTPDSVRPNFISPELFCETCRAIVKEAVKELRTKTKESDVLYYLDNVCDENKYQVYQYVPKDIRGTCGIFMGTYEDALIKLLTKRKIDETKEELAKQLCDDTTEICKGVDVNIFKNIPKIDKNTKINTNVDGEPVKIEFNSNKNETNKNKDEDFNNKKKKRKIKKKKKDKGNNSEL